MYLLRTAAFWLACVSQFVLNDAIAFAQQDRADDEAWLRFRAMRELDALHRAREESNYSRLATNGHAAATVCRELAEHMKANGGAVDEVDDWCESGLGATCASAYASECIGQFDVAAAEWQYVADWQRTRVGQDDRLDNIIELLVQCATNASRLSEDARRAAAKARQPRFLQLYGIMATNAPSDRQVKRAAKAVSVLEDVAPDNHLWHIEAILTHAKLLDRSGRGREATPMYADVQDRIVRVLGPDHAWGVDVALYLGRAHLYANRDVQKAEKELAHAKSVVTLLRPLSTMRLVVLVFQRDILRLECNIATSVNDRDRMRECVEEIQKLCKEPMEAAGRFHSDAFIAVSLWRAGDAAEALRGLQEMRRRLAQLDVPSLGVATLALLGELESGVGSHAAAEEYYQAALKRARYMSEAVSTRASIVAQALAELRLSRGRNDGVADLLNAALPIFEEALGPTHRQTLDCRLVCVREALFDHRVDEAQAALDNLRPALEKALFADDPLHAEATGLQALILWWRGQDAKATAMHEKALDMLRRTLGPESREAEDLVSEAKMWCTRLKTPAEEAPSPKKRRNNDNGRTTDANWQARFRVNNATWPGRRCRPSPRSREPGTWSCGAPRPTRWVAKWQNTFRQATCHKRRHRPTR